MNLKTPKLITKQSSSELKIVWNDDSISIYDLQKLRYSCQCALCKHEITGEKLIKIEDIAPDISIKKVEVVGNYALNFVWSDNHSTGIYSYDYLSRIA